MKVCFLSACLLLAQLMMPSLVLAQERGVRSSLSATTISRDESVTLSIVAIGLNAELDASALDEDFEVIGRSSSQDIRTITGADNRPVTTRTTTWALELIPRDVGIFTVPAVQVGGMRSQIHTLTVNDGPSGAQRDIFVEASVDTQTPWVQSQVILTLTVFQGVEMVDAGLDMPAGGDLVVERLGEDQRRTEERDGRQYVVTERRFALFPQKSGSLVLEPVTLTAIVPSQRGAGRGLFAQTRKLIRRTDSITLDVRPKPDTSAAWWLPADNVELASQWVGGSATATVDQPLTRRIVMRVNGVTDAQLPEINIPAIDGASLYAEQPVRGTASNSQGLVAEQVINWAVIPQRAGLVELPAIEVEWFNTNTGQTETASLPAESLSVAPRESDSSVSPVAEDSANSALSANDSSALLESPAIGRTPTDQLTSSDSGEQQGLDNAVTPESLEQALTSRVSGLESSLAGWRIVALASAFVWLLTLLYVYRSRRSTGSDGRDTYSGKPGFQWGAVRQAGAESLQRIKPMSGIEASVRNEDVPALQQALLEWATRQWPGEPPLTLDALAKRLPDGPARQTVIDVNGMLYGRQKSDDHQSRVPGNLAALPDQLQNALRHKDDETANLRGKANRESSTNLPSL